MLVRAKDFSYDKRYLVMIVLGAFIKRDISRNCCTA